ncbi:CAAX prenyl protease 2 [Holothuria leucospilota]|uniref:CAAX prenyl protease 2 n=1 Tax=Holothuria leucospilota TaxID=206669 RepID=A0A9Q1HD30_HOLLE|nr:CAAX prenyl protease 2 [Holothuria leucospilota]
MNLVRFSCSNVFVACFSCLVLAAAYVGSLYLWRSGLPRDHPLTIKQRIISVLAVSVMCPFGLLLIAEDATESQGYSMWQYLGLRQEAIIPAAVLPLLVTMILFLGPLYMVYLDYFNEPDGTLYSRKVHSKYTSTTHILWLRNYIVAPFTEEFVFRACMLPLLMPCLGPTTSIFVCPLFFGVAHIHHVSEKLRFRLRKDEAIWLPAIFQFFYTSIFGAYSAFLFIRTGHLIGPFLSHAFCNVMGFPAFEQIHLYPPTQRAIIWALLVFGLIACLALLAPATNPEYFQSLFYKSNLHAVTV